MVGFIITPTLEELPTPIKDKPLLKDIQGDVFTARLSILLLIVYTLSTPKPSRGERRFHKIYVYVRDQLFPSF